MTARVYLRVSTTEQNLDGQLLKAKAYLGYRGWDGDYAVYQEKESGANDQRPELQRLLLDMKRGDVLVITRADRLSRSLSHFVRVTEQVHQMGGEIVAVDQPLDTTSPMGMAFWQVLGVFAELERALIRQRTLDGMARAKADGRMTGRHPAGCGTSFPCPWGLDHSPEAVAERNRKKGRAPKHPGPGTHPLSGRKGAASGGS